MNWGCFITISLKHVLSKDCDFKLVLDGKLLSILMYHLALGFKKQQFCSTFLFTF